MAQPLLVAIDSSEQATRVLDAAASFAKQMGVPIKILHIREIEVAGKAGVVWNEEHAETVRIANEAVASVTKAGVAATVSTATVGFGSVARVIVDLAREIDAAAIVVGTKGHTEIGVLLLGSTTHKLLHLIDRPLIVIP